MSRNRKTMKMMFLNAIKLLVLTSVLLRHHSVAENCPHAIPGVRKMITGVDITTLDLVPLEGTTPKGIRFPIFSVTCLNNKTWKSGETTYDLPDQVWALSSVPGGYSQAEIKVMKSTSQVRDRLKAGMSIGGGYGGFAFSASASYQKMQGSIMNSSKQIEDVSSFESAIRIDLEPYFLNPKLDDKTQFFIDNKLKGTYQKNHEIYNEFVKMYGTHYFSRATFGGMIRSYMETSTQYSSKMTDEQIRVQVEASYSTLLASVSGSVSFEKDSTKVSEEFTNSTSKHIKYYGGNTNLLASNGMETWQTSVDSDPWLFSGELVPIYKLIKDEDKKKAITIAIEQHIKRAYLTELVRLVISAKIKYPHELLNDLHKRINIQQNSEILDLYEVTSLKVHVEYHAIVPEWFLWNTRVCLQYYAQYTGHGQCNGQSDTKPSAICSTPNKYSWRYIDNTSSKPGGCVMQWTIISDNPPTWFRYTQICFSWRTEYDIISTWNNNHKNGDSCVKVGNLTSIFVDNTEYSHESTQMSWKLELLEDSPLWLKNSKLCLKWSKYGHDEKNNQCGDGISSGKELCAYPGDWTEWYRDNTQHVYSGGCYLQWSWKL